VLLHENLKRLREKAGLTQAAFAAACGVPLRTVQNWEQGHRAPGLAMLRPLATALGVKVDDLLGDGPAGPLPAVADMVDNAVEAIPPPGPKSGKGKGKGQRKGRKESGK
jgi:transcriptional regulator with XRE-family HTH domain